MTKQQNDKNFNWNFKWKNTKYSKNNNENYNIISTILKQHWHNVYFSVGEANIKALYIIFL